METQIKLCWLGQSGFLLAYGGFSLLADPYLSDSCAKLQSKLDHTRHTPIVKAPETLQVDFYLVTHKHADHFDPETIAPVMANDPSCRFFCPGDCREKIGKFFPETPERFEFVSAGKMVELASGVELHTIPAAHETLEKDEYGEYKAVSYLINFRKENKSIFFGGDTIPYCGQDAAILRCLPAGAELTLCLPVNGRDDARHAMGIDGNMDFDEAIALAGKCSAKLLIPCHIGMFPANDPAEPVTAEYGIAAGVNTILPVAGEEFEI
ncbi:MAG: MBL fold metallo-hydrolase [Lentisphaeria bacterium]|nr:MBL fold metallo-hydrolase [Lentisphaeria bacterium]